MTDEPLEDRSDNPPDETVTTNADERRIQRRTAIRAALAGSAAAATFVAPRLEGLSIAPHYAAAASPACGNNASTNGTISDGSRGMNGCLVNCWGNTNGNTSFNCGNILCDDSCCRNETQTLRLPNATNGPFVLAFTSGGRVGNSGRWSYNVNGIDPPWQQCNVAVNANCNFNGASNVTHNTDGSAVDNTATCNGAGNSNFTLTVTMTCTCA